jgi:hypothetical protein
LKAKNNNTGLPENRHENSNFLSYGQRKKKGGDDPRFESAAALTPAMQRLGTQVARLPD